MTLVSFSNSTNVATTTDAVYAMPATPLQLRLWDLNQSAGPDPAWNVAVRFRLFGPMDREKFERSLQMLATRHEALRTSLALHSGIVVQRIVTRVTLPVEWCDLRHFEADEQAAEVLHLSLEHARQLLPLENAPLFRVRVLRLSDDEHILLWNAHHSICDGWSVGLLASDLMNCYGELLAGREPAARNSLDYGDYAVWLDAQRQTPEYEAHRSYWKQYLSDFKVSGLPDFWRNSGVSEDAPVIHSILLSRTLTDSIADAAHRHDATFFHAALAAFVLLMRVYQKSADVAVETPMSGRDQSELESIVGTFVNYLPLHFRVDAEMSFRGLLHAVCDRVTDSFEHAQFRYEDMLADLRKDGATESAEKLLSPIAFTPIAFICQQDFVHPVAAGGVALTALPSLSPGALRPLTVFMVERADGWRLSCEVDNRVVSAKAGSLLLEDFQRLLTAITAQPEEVAATLLERAGLAPIDAAIPETGNVWDSGSTGNLANEPRDEEGLQDLVRIPATEFQQRFWRLDSMNPGGAAFHVRIRLQLKGALNIDALAEAVARLTHRNEILRTTLEEKNDRIWQVIHPELPIDFKCIVSTTEAPETLRSDAERIEDQVIWEREGQAGFSLSTGPLFRIRLLKMEKDRHWLAITLSHGIVDGWAAGIFLEQLQQAYEQCLAGASVITQKLPVQYSAYAKAERSLLGGTEKERRLTWWRDYLDGIWTPLALPRDLNESAESDGDVRATLETALMASETMLLARRFARECQTTLFAVLGAAFQALLSRYSGQNDVLFLTPHANRTDNTETIMGPLADPICLTGHIGAETTFRELVIRLSEQSMDAMEHALPLNLVMPLVDMRVDRRYHPLNQIIFFYQRPFVHDMEWKGLHIESLPDVPSFTASEWQLGIVERSEGVFLEFLYDATLYSQATIQTVTEHFTRLLTRAVLEPDTSLSHLQILTPAESNREATEASLLPVIQSLLPHTTTVAADMVSSPEDSDVLPVVKAPLSQSERDLVRIWQQLFNIDDVEAESNFFDLGGHSLLLTRMQRIVKRDFGVQLTAADVFRQPTVATLAVWLERARSAAKLAAQTAARHSSTLDPSTLDPRVIPIQPHGAGRPIFVISQSMIFRALAAELGPKQPVYALQMLDEEITLASASFSFEELIDYYLRLIREVQPKGPYRLSGWCVSGWIAYGVARKLEKQGEEIELLMIIDVWAPGYWRNQPKVRRSLMMTVYKVQRLCALVRRLRRGDLSQPDSQTHRNLHGYVVAARNLKAWLRDRKPPAKTPLVKEMQLRGEQLEATACLAQLTGALRGRVLLFRSGEEPSGALLAPEMGWLEMLGRPVHVEVLPGSHYEIFGLPGARMMATRAREILDTPLFPYPLSESPDKSPKPKNGVHTAPMVGV